MCLSEGYISLVAQVSPFKTSFFFIVSSCFWNYLLEAHVLTLELKLSPPFHFLLEASHNVTNNLILKPQNILTLDLG